MITQGSAAVPAAHCFQPQKPVTNPHIWEAIEETVFHHLVAVVCETFRRPGKDRVLEPGLASSGPDGRGKAAC